jgi:hypothetical protein
MDKRKDTDILGQTVEVGDVICFCSSGAQLDVGVVTSLKHRRNGDLIGYNIIYPLYPYMFSRREDKTMVNKEKLIRAGREVIILPAGQLGSLASGQARRTDSFVGRLQYLREKILKGREI